MSEEKDRCNDPSVVQHIGIWGEIRDTLTSAEQGDHTGGRQNMVGA